MGVLVVSMMVAMAFVVLFTIVGIYSFIVFKMQHGTRTNKKFVRWFFTNL